MSEVSKFINRELSWLEFNQRVLDQARNPDLPVLERLKFLAITGTNLDEFFMVRVGGLQILQASKSSKRDQSGMSASQQLAAVRERALQMVADQYHCLENELMPLLKSIGIRRADISDLTDRQLTQLKRVFEEEIFTVLSPMFVDQPDNFPLMNSGLLYACVRLEYDEEQVLKPLDVPNTVVPNAGDSSVNDRFVVIPFGEQLSRILTIPAEDQYEFVLLEDVLRHFAHRFFGDQKVLDFVSFRVVRNADVALQADDAADLMSEMVESLDARTEAACVRLEIDDQVSDETLAFLKESLEIEEEQIYRAAGPLRLGDFMKLGSISGFEYAKYERWRAQPSPDYDETMSLFRNLRRGDILLYHPYQSFDPIVRFIEQAADDPDVLSIKQTLYRVSGDSAIVKALIRAAEAGKNVTVIVELKARFDERRNIHWARQLAQAGANVIYGIRGLKTHAKICLVTRRDADGIRRYCHFGTGNYNENTSGIYSDASLLTCDPELGADATDFFNAVTGYSQPSRFRKIEAAPIGLRERLIEMIEFETHQAQAGMDAAISVKINSLTDPQVIEKLYEASNAGVRIRANVRGVCCLRPGVEGMSENIEVVSIVDRFLEHARIIHFHHGGDRRVFISSADWMNRNLSGRVELLVPVENRICKARLINILDFYFSDNQQSSRLCSDGHYQRIQAGKDKEFRSQEVLFHRACEAAELVKRGAQMMLQPHFANHRN